MKQKKEKNKKQRSFLLAPTRNWYYTNCTNKIDTTSEKKVSRNLLDFQPLHVVSSSYDFFEITSDHVEVGRFEYND
jgi:hypothetical protein